MAIVDLFSKRQKRQRGDVRDGYVYDSVPEALRVQIWQLIENASSIYTYPAESNLYKPVVNILRREYGTSHLLEPNSRIQDFRTELEEFFLTETDALKVLDVVELCFSTIHLAKQEGLHSVPWFISAIRPKRAETQRQPRASDAIEEFNERFSDAIKELNARFLEHGIGYEFSNNKIIRIDSKFVHAEVVKPALTIVDKKRYHGVQDEFLKAHEHYRHGNYKESLNECSKAFESMLKTICDKRKWKYGKRASAKNLIDICLKKELVPSFWQSHFSSLVSMLEGGIPTARNQLSAHGQGTTPTSVPKYLVGYALHMTASVIVFLEGADKEKK